MDPVVLTTARGTLHALACMAVWLASVVHAGCAAAP